MPLGIDVLGLTASFTTFFGIYAILSLSLNLEYGFAGQPNFGQVLFYSVGCYSAGYISTVFLITLRGVGTGVAMGSSQAIVLRQLGAQLDPQLNIAAFVVSLIVGFCVAVFAGYVASYPALKLREDFLAITLLAAGEITRVLIRGIDWFSGGAQGITGMQNPFIWVSDTRIGYLAYASVVLGLALFAYFCLSKLTNSPYGRLLKSVREDELASSSFGKNVPRVRGMVLGVGSGFAGMAGVLYTFYSGFIQADSFLPAITFAVWVMVIVGGSANLKGSLVGALIVSAIDTTTRVFSFQIQASMPSITIAPDYFRYIAYAVMILLVLMYRSKGLLPEKPTKTPAWAVIGKEAE